MLYFWWVKHMLPLSRMFPRWKGGSEYFLYSEYILYYTQNIPYIIYIYWNLYMLLTQNQLILSLLLTNIIYEF